MKLCAPKARENLGIFVEKDPHDLFERHFELIIETYRPYTVEGSFPLNEVNPFHTVKNFIKSIDLAKRKFPREEFLLLDRSTLGLFLKLKKWNSHVNWVDSMKKYRGALDLENRKKIVV